MFELNGIQYSMETLQQAALKYDMPFEDYMGAMEKKGLKKLNPNFTFNHISIPDLITAILHKFLFEL